jgi:hypothetical protein
MGQQVINIIAPRITPVYRGIKIYLGGRSMIAKYLLVMVVTLGIAGCSAPDTNTNTANTNAEVEATPTATPTPEEKAEYNRDITREQYDKDKDKYDREAKESGRTIGTGANDGWLWVKTRATLLTEDELRDSTIDVDVDNSVVTLSGTVASKAQIAKAAQAAKGIEGVKSVKNQLKVKVDNEEAEDEGHPTNTNSAAKKKAAH